MDIIETTVNMAKKNRLALISFLCLLPAAAWHYGMVEKASEKVLTRFLVHTYSLLALIGLTSLLVFYVLLKKCRKAMQYALFTFLVVMLTGSLYSVVLPPLAAPDEVSHYISAYKLSSFLLGEPVCSREGYVLVRAQDLFIEDPYSDAEVLRQEEGELSYIYRAANENSRLLSQYLDYHSYNAVYNSAEALQAENQYMEYSGGLARSAYTPVNTTPLIYLPSALGIGMARLLEADSIGLLFMGRLGNLLFFALGVSVAVYFLPFGREMLMGLIFLPMSLHLAGSYSYDAAIIACVFMFIAYILHLTYRKASVQKRDILFLMLLVCLFGPCKIVYFPLVAFGLIVPIQKFGKMRNWLLAILCIGGALLAAMYIVNYRIISSYALEVEALLPYKDAPKYTLQYLLGKPREFVSLFYLTLLHELEFYHVSMLGGYLGNIDLQIGAPYILVFAMTLCLFFLSCPYRGEGELRIEKRHYAYGLLLFFGMSFLILLSMLIAWTPMSSRWIIGVQGRYFLPILPLLLFGFKYLGIKLEKDWSKEIMYICLCLNIYTLLYVFSLVSDRY